MKIKVLISIIILVSFLAIMIVSAQTEDNTTETGYYLIRSNIDGAEVYFDNELMGVIVDNKLTIEVPITSTPSYNTFSITAEGYTTYNGTILQVPLSGETISMRGNLKLKPITGNGTISIGCSPPGTSVFLDEVFLGVIDYSGVMRLSEIEPGQHVMRFEMTDYQPHEEYLYVTANIINQIRVELIPIPRGTLLVTSVPSGASVQIDGKYQGTTPLTLPGMDIRDYAIVASMAGYNDWSGSVSVLYNSTNPVEAILIPIPTPIPTTPVTPTSTPIPTTPVSGPLPVMVVSALGLIGLWYQRKF